MTILYVLFIIFVVIFFAIWLFLLPALEPIIDAKIEKLCEKRDKFFSKYSKDAK